MGTAITCHAEGLLDIGKQRNTNQDEIILLDEIHFYAVSDGMGGLINGGETSALIKSLLPVALEMSIKAMGQSDDPHQAAGILKEKIQWLCDEVYWQGIVYGPNQFGATLCGVWITGRVAVFVNIGDSRAYLFINGELCQITSDHSIAAHLIAHGELTAEEARTHPSRSRLMRYVGMKPPVHPDMFIENLSTDCEILLCSDGLYGMLTDEEIAKILEAGGDDAVKRLIDAANHAGGDDNISVVLIRFRKQGV
ncbi:MAG: protein phosphatase 2C domain-containing protein [Oscillospiraceae bacterium]|nr:protein phosphatase 2C domain-containing protein [Oscillospiraceae bacterium]